MVKWKKMNKKMAGLLLGVMMLFTASTTAFAYVDESAEASKVETTQTDQSTDKEEKKDEATNTNEVLPEDGTDKETAFTTPGNGEVKDDITDDSTKEFLTVTTKNNNTFYIVIDRSATSQKLDTFIAIANALDVSADTLLIDVVTHSVTGVTNELSEMIAKLPKEKQQRIINAVRALVE